MPEEVIAEFFIEMFASAGADAAVGAGLEGGLAGAAGAAGAEGLAGLTAGELGAGALAAGELGGGLGELGAEGGLGLAPDLSGPLSEGFVPPSGDPAAIPASGDPASALSPGELSPDVHPQSPGAPAGDPSGVFDISTTPEGVLQPTLQDVTAPAIDTEIPTADKTISQQAFDLVKNNKLTTAALGMNALSAFNQRGAAGKVPGQLKEVAKPFTQTGQDLIDQYKTGKLNPADEFNINQWQQQQIAKVKDFYRRAGGADSSAALKAVSDVEAKAQSMRDTALQGLLKEGLAAMNMGTGPLTAAITAESSQDQAFMQSQASALNSLMLLNALGSSRPGTGP